jgi:hypothetical protein
MSKDQPTPNAPAAAETAKPASSEPANVVVDVLIAHTKIGNAICGRGRCSFPLTKRTATALEELGKVKIVGVI